MDDSTAGHIELEYIVVDLVREKRLELVNGTHVLGLNSLLSISLVYSYIRHLPHSITTRYPRVPVCVLCIQSRNRCQRAASQVGFRFATLVSPAGRDQNPVSTVRPFRFFTLIIPLFSPYPKPLP